MIIQSVDKAMHILQLVSDHKNTPVTLAQISQSLGANKSTCSHLVCTLLQGGYLERVSHSKGYILGPSVYHLSRFGRYENDFTAFCRPALRYLYQRTQKSVILSVMKNCTKFIVDYIDKDGTFFSDKTSIRMDDIYRTATGRILLSHQDKDQLQQIYTQCGNPTPNDWNGISSFDDLRHALASIKQAKIAQTISPKTVSYHIGYGVPIYRNNTCVAALGVAIDCPQNDLERFLQTEALSIQHTLSLVGEKLSRQISETDWHFY